MYYYQIFQKHYTFSVIFMILRVKKRWFTYHNFKTSVSYYGMFNNKRWKNANTKSITHLNNRTVLKAFLIVDPLQQYWDVTLHGVGRH